MMIGFAIHPRSRRVSTSVAARFRELPVANISDVMSRMAAGGARLRPLYEGNRLAGPALTVRTRPGDNLMTHKALDLAEPGDVIVVDAGGDLTNSIIGELMVAYMVHRRLGGIVINGAIRDSETIRKGQFPVYAAGVTHRGPYKDGPGEINVSVSLDGMVIEPGDLMVGDADGLLCIPYDLVETVYREAAKKRDSEEKRLADIAAWDRSWVDASLERLGCEFNG